MSVTNDLFLHYGLAYLKGDDRGCEQAYCLDHCLRGSRVQSADNRSPTELRSNHDKYDSRASEQNSHEPMDCRDQTQNVFHLQRPQVEWSGRSQLCPNHV